ncbi:hypothetical protein LDENG_00105190, partial [Lucifuga dentata]
VVTERYRFRQRGQHAGETADQYVAALKELITTCEFGAMEEEMIRDQLVEKTNSPCIRERLLLEVPLTLTKAMTIARQIETAVAEAKAMCTGAVDSTVHTVQSKGPQQHGKFKKGQCKLHPPTQATQGKTRYRCGSTQHTANFHGCPAKEVSCNACKKKGHFARVCKGSKRVTEVVVPELTILNVNTYDSGSIMCTVKVSVTGTDSQNIELMVDTGSAVSIRPESKLKVAVEKLGCAKAFTHLVKICPDVKPVQQKLRRLPFSVREAVCLRS